MPYRPPAREPGPQSPAANAPGWEDCTSCLVFFCPGQTAGALQQWRMGPL